MKLGFYFDIEKAKSPKEQKALEFINKEIIKIEAKNFNSYQKKS